MSLIDAIFNKGGIGRSFSRHETAARVNEVLRQQIELNHAYAYVIKHLSDANLVQQMELFQKKARADTGKLRETIYSAGGVAYTGTDLEAEDFNLGTEDDAMLFQLLDQEQALVDTIEGELNVKGIGHQIRTKAILRNTLANSQERLAILKEHTRRRQRSASAS